MENNNFDILRQIVESRRTTKPATMNGNRISDEVIKQLLELAIWAPTHGRTEPWAFFVYTGQSLSEFGKMHAETYWNNTPEEKRNIATYEKLMQVVDKPSHLIVAVMKKGGNQKIPVLEEIAAASAAIQNILLGASALGIASMWNTGGMTHMPALKQQLGLSADDLVLGLLYLGYVDDNNQKGFRNKSINEVTYWR